MRENNTEHLMADEHEEQAGRKEKIQALIESIMASKKPEQLHVSKGNTGPYAKSGRGRGKRSEYKVYVGWQHYNRNSFRVVTSAKGGGTRTITRKAGENITVEEIIEQAKKFFFKDGKSYFGMLEIMSVCLANSSGEEISEFTDTNGNACTFTKYLKAYGMFPSQCHLYLRTKTDCVNDTELSHNDTEILLENDSSADSETVDLVETKKKVFLVNDQQAGTLDILYGKIKQSLYSSSNSAIYCRSYKTCISLAGNNEIHDDYNVFEDGFIVSGVSKNNKQYLVENENNYSFPETINRDTNDLLCIIHGPDKIYGTEADDSEHLLLGALTIYHNQSYLYKWYKDDHRVESGNNHCLLRISEPGTYTVEIVCSENVIFKSMPVSVSVSDQQDRIPAQPQTFTTLSQPQIITTLSQPQTFTTLLQPQTFTTLSQPQTFTTESQPQAPTTLSQPHTLTTLSQPQTFTTLLQPQTFTTLSQLQTFTTESQPQAPTTLSQPQTLTTLSQPQTFTTLSQPQTFTTVSQPQTFTMVSQPQTFTTLSQPQTFTTVSQPQTFTTLSQPQTFTTLSQPHTITTESQPHTFTTLSQPQTFTTISQPQTFTTESQPQTFTTLSQPQTFTTLSQPQTFTTLSQPHTFTTLSKPQTFTTLSQPQTFTTLSQPHTFTTESQPLTFTTLLQPQTFTTLSQSQTFTTLSQPQTFTTLSQPQTFTTLSQPHTFTTLSQPQTFSTSVSLQTVTTPSQQTVGTPAQPQTSSSTTRKDSVPVDLQTDCGPVKPKYMKSGQAEHTTILASPSTSSSSCTVCVPRVNLTDVNLSKEIGRGGFGVVYQGRWIGTKVAVKEIVIKRMKIAKPFIDRELCVHSQLRHPNIVLLMAHAMENNRLYLISELIDGCTLDNCLFGVGGEAMNMSLKLNVSLKISQAVAYLHSQNPLIIHRDIKPENVLVAENFNVVKLCDMGLSKLKTMNTVMTTMAGGSIQPGTPAYQAPEVLLERRSANSMTDIWSLACTLVEVMVEMPIWNSVEDTVQYILNRMKLKAKPDGLDLLASLADIDEKIYNILDKGLSYSAGVRPQALEIVEYLYGLLEATY